MAYYQSSYSKQQARNRERYWVEEDGDDLADEIMCRVDAYYRAVEDRGIADLWRRSARLYRGLDPDGGYKKSSAVTFAGKRGEIAQVSINHYRSFIRAVHSLVTATRPAINVRAANASSEAAEQAMLFNHIVEYDLTHGKLEDTLARAAVFSFEFAEGAVYQTWDVTMGREYGVDPSSEHVVQEGGVRAVPVPPQSLIRDPYAPCDGDDTLEWWIVRRRMNRWGLVAQYAAPKRTIQPDAPEEPVRFEAQEMDAYGEDLRRHILALPAVGDDSRWLMWNNRQSTGVSTSYQDYVWVYDLVVPPSLACPEGRWARCAEGKLLCPALRFPYGHMPVHVMVPDVDEESPFGYASTFDLMGPQQAYDAIASTRQTNLDAFGLFNVWTRMGDSLKARTLAGGLKHLQSKEKPEILSAPRMSGDADNALENLQRSMERLIGMNSASMGDPEEHIKSGSYGALVAAMAVRFNSDYQRAYGRMIESCLNGRLDLYKRFATTERLVDIAGDDHSYPAQTWDQTKIQQVSKVTIELADPIMQTSEGRLRLADSYAEKEWITTPEQYSMVLATGRAEPLFKRDRNEMRLVAVENDALRKAARDPQIREQVEGAAALGPDGDMMISQIVMEIAPVIPDWQRNLLHMTEHFAELNSPSAFADDVYAHLVRVHLQLHRDGRRNLIAMDPAQAEAMGEPPSELEMQAIAPPPMPMGPDGAPMGPPGGPAPLEPPEPTAEEQVGVPPDVVTAASPGGTAMPNMPIEPLAGERANPMEGA